MLFSDRKILPADFVAVSIAYHIFLNFINQFFSICDNSTKILPCQLSDALDTSHAA
jgi:hypothetical protein